MDDLAIFLAVCRAGGFRSAARQLRLSPSHVSETVARLEARLSVPLLIRTTRSVRATEAGRALADRVSPLLRETRAALQDATSTRDEVRGFLKLSVPGAVMTDILPPLIDRFLLAHPQVRVEIVVNDRFVDLATADCDAGIRYREHLGQDMIATPIGPRVQQAAFAAAPHYLAARGVPEHPRDLMSHDCIRMRFSSGALVEWEFERAGEVMTIDPPSRLIIGVDAVGAAIDLARAGRGVIGTFRNWMEPHLRSGDLVPVLEQWWQRFEGPMIYFKRKSISAPLRVFLNLVAEDRRRSADAAQPTSTDLPPMSGPQHASG
ncbi:MAG: LysR family transcriptional regulator [Proteobacteria bacterium]|nr:LysR family transcriptional regulator [Pseudomonadota bacterium]